MKSLFRIICFTAVLTVLMAASAAVHCSKKPPADQFLNVAPLPGAGGAINSLGEPDGQGAMQINIPVAYTPGKDFVDIGAFAGQWIGLVGASSENLWRNGSGWVGMGFGSKRRVYASAMFVSSILLKDSKAVSVQVQLSEETDKLPAFAYGMQDIGNKEREFADISNTGISHYAIATKSFTFKDRPLYATAGYGTAKFRERFIGGLSYSMSDSFSASVEYDGFQYNSAIGWRPKGRFSQLTVLGGLNGRCGALVGLHFSGKLDNKWAVPIGASMLRRWY